LKRELARHVYAAALTPDVQVARSVRQLDLTPEQHEAIGKLDKAAARIRLAKLKGGQDIEAAREVAGHLFDDAHTPEAEAAAVQQVHDSLPLLREAAVRRVIDDPAGAKGQDMLAHVEARKGKPGVIFARHLHVVDALRQKLEAAGHRVVTITGADSAESKAEKIRAFNPESGERTADVVLASDAGAVGANLQSGKWLAQYDTPDTAMVHAQRQGRINRIGAKGDLELTDLVANHPREKRARDRLATKYGLRELVTTPTESLDDSGLAFYLKQQQAAAQQAALF
jgi:superfamily II DNA/RNA helicase